MDHNKKIKEEFIKEVEKTPILRLVCKKVGVSKSSIYRWRKQDQTFDKAIKLAQEEGTENINDLAESKLISAINDKNLRAIVFWLKNNSDKYRTKVELQGSLSLRNEPLTDEQQKTIEQALALSGLIKNQ